MGIKRRRKSAGSLRLYSAFHLDFDRIVYAITPFFERKKAVSRSKSGVRYRLLVCCALRNMIPIKAHFLAWNDSPATYRIVGAKNFSPFHQNTLLFISRLCLCSLRICKKKARLGRLEFKRQKFRAAKAVERQTPEYALYTRAFNSGVRVCLNRRSDVLTA